MLLNKRTGHGLCSILLICVAALSLVGAGSSLAVQSKPGSPPAPVKVATITPEEAKALITLGAGLVMVDTRPEEAYRKMHITGAVNLPWKEMIGEPVDLPRNQLLVLYCDCQDDSTSSDVARQLISNWGYTEVKVLKSGLDGWLCLGFPMQGDTSEKNSCK